MICKFSTGLRNAMLDSEALSTLLNGGKIVIYKGVAPATADADVSSRSGDVLVEITASSGATGLTFGAATNGSIPKEPAEVWSGVCVASGTASWFRHVGPSDTGGNSTTEPRIQGDVGLAGAAINLSSVSLTSGATQTLDFYTVALPTN